jgi:hypothetical protein
MQKTSTSIGSINLVAFGKCIIFFGLLAFPRTTASGQERQEKRISVNLQSVSLREALDQIQALSGVDLVYSGDIFDLDQKVTLTIVEQPIETVLARMLGSRYQYKQVDNNIVISRSVAQTTGLPAQ